MTLIQTLRLLASDYRAMRDLLHIKPGPVGFIFQSMTPPMIAIVLYRFSRWFYLKRLRACAWLLWLAGLFLTGAEILPSSDIGPSFAVGHCRGVVITAKLGARVKIYGQAAIGGGLGTEDVGAGPGLPVIGDDVVIGFRATILGPIVIGDGASIGAMSYVNKPVPAGASAIGNPCRVVTVAKKDAASEEASS